MDSTIAGFLGTILGGVIGVVGAYTTANKMFRVQRFDTAATKFRSAVIYELEGFYPKYFESDKLVKLTDTIPQINKAAAEFIFFLDDGKSFRKALSAYNTYCTTIHEKDVRNNVAREVFNEKYRSTTDDCFQKIVDHLLSFTKKKTSCGQTKIIRKRLDPLLKKIKGRCS